MIRALTVVILLLATACSSPPPAVFVVRHAEAYSNLKPTPDLPPATLDSLTDKGLLQARRLADQLQGQAIDLILHSPTGRTTETASIIAKALGIELQPAPELASLTGPWDNRETSWASGHDPRPEGGESMSDGIDRALTLLKRYPNQTLVLVTHSDIAAGLIGQPTNTPIPNRYAQHKPKTGSLTPIPNLR